jgi:ATP-dependent DNA ligase
LYRSLSHRLKDVTRHDKNAFIEPMLLLAADMLLEGPGWGYGLKLDGFRVVGIKTGGLVRLRS